MPWWPAGMWTGSPPSGQRVTTRTSTTSSPTTSTTTGTGTPIEEEEDMHPSEIPADMPLVDQPVGVKLTRTPHESHVWLPGETYLAIEPDYPYQGVWEHNRVRTCATCGVRYCLDCLNRDWPDAYLPCQPRTEDEWAAEYKHRADAADALSRRRLKAMARREAANAQEVG